MLDAAIDVDFVASASVSVANTSVASVSGYQYLHCQYQLPVSLAASTSVASASGARYFSCQCLCLVCLLVPWLVSRFCAIVAKDITKPVAEDSREIIVEDTHESSAKISCIPTLITSNNNRSGYM